MDPHRPDDLRSSTEAIPSRAHAATRLRVARWGVLVLLASAVASAYLTRHCLAVANTTMQAELHINNEEFGYLYSAFSLGYLLFQVPGGWLGQRFGPRVTMPLLSLLWSIATVATALMTALPALVATRFAFGLAQAGLIPNQAKVLENWFPVESRGSASAAIVMAMSVGSIASLSLTSWLMQRYDWRSIFLAYSLVGVGWAVLFYAAFRSRPADVGWLRGAVPSPPRPESPAAGIPRTSGRETLYRFLSNRSIWGLTCQAFFKAAGYNLLVTFFPAFLELAYEIPREEAGTLTSWSLIGLVVGSLLGGWLIDRLQRQTNSKRISRCVVAVTTLTLTAVLMLAACGTATARQMAAVMAAAALVSGVANACPWAAIMDIGGSNTAVAMGCLNCGASLAGILVTPALGQLIDRIRGTAGDWNQVIYIHAAFYLAAGLCWLAVDPERTIDGPAG